MVVSDMKKFIIHILLFFATVAVVDLAAGQLFFYLQSAIAKGRTKVEYYACKESNEEVLIMGSSRASHHYVPQIIEDSLGLKCFNAGQDGNGIILQYGRWKMISERHTPKLIVYDVTPNFDVALNDNMTYVDRLKPFSGNSAVKDYISAIFPLERIKLFSHMYRYNYKFLEIMSDCAAGNVIQDGYAPLYGLIRQEIVNQDMQSKTNIKEDDVKLHYLEKLLEETSQKGTKVVLVLSPSYRGAQSDKVAISAMKDVALRHDVLFLDYSNDSICNEESLFYDSAHLNDDGAQLFTRNLIAQIIDY